MIIRSNQQSQLFFLFVCLFPNLSCTHKLHFVADTGEMLPINTANKQINGKNISKNDQNSEIQTEAERERTQHIKKGKKINFFHCCHGKWWCKTIIFLRFQLRYISWQVVIMFTMNSVIKSDKFFFIFHRNHFYLSYIFYFNNKRDAKKKNNNIFTVCCSSFSIRWKWLTLLIGQI